MVARKPLKIFPEILIKILNPFALDFLETLVKNSRFKIFKPLGCKNLNNIPAK